MESFFIGNSAEGIIGINALVRNAELRVLVLLAEFRNGALWKKLWSDSNRVGYKSQKLFEVTYQEPSSR